SSKALGRAGMIPGLPRLLLLVIFLVKLQSGGLGSQNTTMPGALCPASSSLLCFIGWSYPQIVLYSRFLDAGAPAIGRLATGLGLARPAIGRYFADGEKMRDVAELCRLHR